MTKTLHALFDDQGVTDGGLAALSEITPEDAQAVIAEYVARYVNERLLQVIGDGLQSLPVEDIVLREAEVWDYIHNRAQLDLHDVDVLQLDWGGPQASALIERIFVEAHRLLEHP